VLSEYAKYFHTILRTSPGGTITRVRHLDAVHQMAEETDQILKNANQYGAQ
jgi:hypothetical protein